jgi:hypothetical protein
LGYGQLVDSGRLRLKIKKRKFSNKKIKPIQHKINK